MRPRFLPLFLCFGLIGGCGVGLDDINLSAIGIGGEEVDSEIAAGAADFVSCNLGQECDYLWEQARFWLDENARFSVELKNEVTLTAFSPAPDKHRDEFQYRITKISHEGGVATIKAEAFCSDQEACGTLPVEQVYKINEFLRNHKRALNEGVVEVEDFDAPELPRVETPAALEDDGTLAEMSQELEKEYRRGQYHDQARDALAGAGCLKQSKMSLLKSGGGEDLYEVSCLTGIRQIVFRCTRDGCSVLQ